ncbi:MAG: hypothetical protein ACKVY0_23445 [Prosthecobacter sp.]|uniref:hypothetical protein n=1 Tax=Prosthecobacter sp. TaxID=1965333 RepID=UPI00390175D0
MSKTIEVIKSVLMELRIGQRLLARTQCGLEMPRIFGTKRKLDGGGQVNPDDAKMLLKKGYNGPISLHLEYLEGKATDPAVLKEFRAAHARDVKTLHNWLGWA